ncbi:MAG: ABC-type multidrug transport system ATPase subunit, partial [Planctomycetota bacterium]
MSANPLAINIQDLNVRVAGRQLLKSASLEVPSGEVVLLVGLSGSGKSVTLKLLLGLINAATKPFEISGTIELCGDPLPGAASQHAGIVFQDFGLLDEWTTRENLEFGLDHRRGARPSGEAGKAIVDGLLNELNLDGSLRTTALSGGMKQRCAIARTLAHDPDIIFYDEPTSGLDPAMSAQVAERIKKTNREHAKTSFIVTHDLGSLSGIADRIILLDPVRKSFHEIAKENVDVVMAELTTSAALDDNIVPRKSSVGVRLKEFFTASGRSLEAGAIGLLSLVPRWPRFKWGFRYLVYYLRLGTFGSALAYVAICGFILGLIITWFTFSFLPFKTYTEPLLIDNVIGAIGFSLYRIMVPGMVAMLVAARSGAAIAADVGNRVYTRQTDAMRSFGIEPNRYLLTNILWAHLIGMPVLIAVNYVCARAGSLVVFAAIKPEYSTYFWQT